jgi:hypothetical protein
MARLLKLADLEARKQALVAESEIYRQTLQVEFHNIQLSIAGTSRKLSHFKSLFAIVPVGSSLLGVLVATLFRRKKSETSGLRILPTALMGWRLYQKYGSMLQPLVSKFINRRRNSRARGEDRTPAANI